MRWRASAAAHGGRPQAASWIERRPAHNHLPDSQAVVSGPSLDPWREAPPCAADSAPLRSPRSVVLSLRSGQTSSVNLVQQARPADAAFAEREVHEQRLALHVRTRHEAPEAAVLGVVAVVAHHEVVAGGHDHRAVVQLEATAAHVNGVGRTLVHGKQEVDVRLVDPRAVDEDALVPHFDGYTGQPDHTLDEVAIRILRKLEDEDVAAADGIDR